MTRWRWKPTVYFDMDGVIADWAAAVAELFGVDPMIIKECEKQSGDDDLIAAVGMPSKNAFWKAIANVGLSFWYGIPELDDGMQLLRQLEELEGLDVRILTKPTYDSACYNGKALWVQKRMGKNTDCLTLSREKWRSSGPNTLLIDDDPKNIDMFNDGFGTGLLISRPFDQESMERRARTFERALEWAQEAVRTYEG